LPGSSSVPSGFHNLVASAEPGAVLIELSMICSTPPFLRLLNDVMLGRLESIVEQAKLPASDTQMRILTQLLALATRAPSLARTRTLPQADKWQALLKTLLARALPTVAELLVDDKLHEEAHRDHMQRSASGKGTASTKTSAKGSQAEGAPGSAASGGEGAASVPGFGGEKKPALPSSLDKLLEKGHGRHLVLLYAIRRVEAADVTRCEQLLPRITQLAKGLEDHPEFAGGLVSALLADPQKRLTPRLARVTISQCLAPLAALMPHAHMQLLRLMQAQWTVLNSIPAEDVSSEQKQLDGSFRTAAMGPSSGADERVLTLLQSAASNAYQHGAVAEADKDAVKRAYAKLGKLVPGLLHTGA